MKFRKLSFLGMALLAILSLNLSCNDQSNNEVSTEVIDPPIGIITLSEADAIYDNYSKHRVAGIESYETEQRAPKEEFQAARFVDFDYQMIKDYIAYVDQEAAKAGVKKVTKLRMYFANYPDKKKFSDGKAVVHPRQNSLFLLPTMAAKNGDYGFYIGADGKAKLIADWKASNSDGTGSILQEQEFNTASLVPNFFSSTNLKEGTSLTLNRGHSGPPPYGDF